MLEAKIEQKGIYTLDRKLIEGFKVVKLETLSLDINNKTSLESEVSKRAEILGANAFIQGEPDPATTTEDVYPILYLNVPDRYLS